MWFKRSSIDKKDTRGKKQKPYTVFSDVNHAEIGSYTAVVKKFLADCVDLGESKVHLFKKRKLEEVRKVPKVLHGE